MAFLPHYLSGLHFEAGRFTFAVVMAAVDIVADSDKAAMMVLESAGTEEVNLFRFDTIACSSQL